MRPQGFQHAKETGVLRGEPESPGQPEVARSGGEGHRGSTVLDEGGDLVGGAEIGLADDAGFALDAGAFDHVVVEFGALLLGDEGGHNRVIQLYTYSASSQLGLEHFAIEMLYMG